jgi:hypothetical protein
MLKPSGASVWLSEPHAPALPQLTDHAISVLESAVTAALSVADALIAMVGGGGMRNRMELGCEGKEDSDGGSSLPGPHAVNPPITQIPSRRTAWRHLIVCLRPDRNFEPAMLYAVQPGFSFQVVLRSASRE